MMKKKLFGMIAAAMMMAGYLLLQQDRRHMNCRKIEIMMPS